MKNLLKITLYLSVFALAGILFQISCSNSDFETQNANSTPIGKIVYQTGDKIWIANYDGTNATQIPIVLPANVLYFFNTTSSSLTVSPDGNTIFFTCVNTTNPSAPATKDLYSCSINGGNATLVISSNGVDNQSVGSAVAF